MALPARSWALVTLRAKFESFGWLVMEMDGNDMDAVVAGLEKAKTMTGQENLFAYSAKTTMGKGNRLYGNRA